MIYLVNALCLCFVPLYLSFLALGCLVSSLSIYKLHCDSQYGAGCCQYHCFMMRSWNKPFTNPNPATGLLAQQKTCHHCLVPMNIARRASLTGGCAFWRPQCHTYTSLTRSSVLAILLIPCLEWSGTYRQHVQVWPHQLRINLWNWHCSSL